MPKCSTHDATKARHRRKMIMAYKRKKCGRVAPDANANVNMVVRTQHICTTLTGNGESLEKSVSLDTELTPLSTITTLMTSGSKTTTNHSNATKARHRRKMIMAYKRNKHGRIVPEAYSNVNMDVSTQHMLATPNEDGDPSIGCSYDQRNDPHSEIIDLSRSFNEHVDSTRDHSNATKARHRRKMIMAYKRNKHGRIVPEAYSNVNMDVSTQHMLATPNEDGDPSIGCSYDQGSDPHSKIIDLSRSFNEHVESTREIDYTLTIYHTAESEDVLDLGDPTYVCDKCFAQMWYEERVDKCKTTNQLQYSLCCMKGRINLPFLGRPPALLNSLNSGEDPRSRNYKEHIRAYNNMFGFTSLGGKVENMFNEGGGPPQFILSGQNFHRIGSLVPTEGTVPKFAQLYIYDTKNEIANRCSHFRSIEDSKGIDISLVEDLKKMIDENNPLAKSFRRVRDYLMEDNISNISLRLIKNRSKDARMHNLPTSDEVAALIVGDFDQLGDGRDVIVKKNGELTRMPETHTEFLPLQYPLLFPYGEDGWNPEISISDSFLNEGDSKRKTVALREFIAFRIQERQNEYGNIVNARRLFQQFVVDCYTMIEGLRLKYIRLNQKNIRCELLNSLQEAVVRGENDASSIGKRIILPASFTGGMRYMFNNCQDAMAICKRFGYPDLFITITCNANWREIRDFVTARGLTASDRPDIVCRVFKMKLDQMMTDFKKDKIFGNIVAGTYTIEFQKRGLPHAHILLWLETCNKLKTTIDIDKYISAELPDYNSYPKLAKVVSNYMIHGPCGRANFKSPCMKNGKCSKYFPKSFQSSTTIDDEGYPKYKRRDNGLFVLKKDIKVDNRSVVPYNPHLLMRYQAHVNVEYCNKSNSIKYLFKYVNKGPDRASIELSQKTQNGEQIDEIKQFYDCRYLAPCEAVWRTFGFDIHHRWPPVQRLTFHLLNSQSIIYEDEETVDSVLEKNEELQTMFLAWFEANKQYEEGRQLTYAEFPTKFVYNKRCRQWQPRKQGTSIGRLHYIPPGSGQLYYMRLLLTLQKGCTSYESIRTVNGITYETFEEACTVLRLLDDDNEFINAIEDLSYVASGKQLRRLFVMLLVMNSMSQPLSVWNRTWKLLSDGILYERRKALNIPDYTITEEELQNLCLIELDKLLLMNGKSLKSFMSLPCPSYSTEHDLQNILLVDELNYDKEGQAKIHDSLLKSLTTEQRYAYDQIMSDVLSNSGGFFFLYGYGGTGKTYVWKTLSASLRSKGMIVLNVASSGIASLLLPGGKTAHSTFCIPLLAKEDSTCNINKDSLRAQLLLRANLIIWDEAPMLHRYCFEAVDRTLRDIMSAQDKRNLYKPFGGKTVVLGGDFRQILPVIRKGSRHDIVQATVNSSKVWSNCKVLKLSVNMRLGSSSLGEQADEIKQFAEWILAIGDGKYESNEFGESNIEIPDDLIIKDCENPLRSLVEFTYPNMLQNLHNFNFFEERAILAPTLDAVEYMNDFILGMIPGEECEYLSSDSTIKSDEDCEIQGDWFTTEFLNDIKCSGVPNHKLKLKVNVPVMLMRNIDQANGLCNGTRLMVNDLRANVIGVTVISGKNIGDTFYIPRMNLVPTDPGYPFKFQRRQFPLCMCFAMTINKSQGQSLSHVGLYMQKPVFTHGQLYVALSRVKSRKGLKILILDEEGTPCSSTTNVVYTEVFQNL